MYEEIILDEANESSLSNRKVKYKNVLKQRSQEYRKEETISEKDIGEQNNGSICI